MNNNSSKTPWYVYQPLIYTVLIITGVYIGIYIFPSRLNSVNSSNKINNIISIIKQNYVDTVNVEQMIGNAINGMLQNLDPHSVYIPAEELVETNETLEGNFEGIGIQFNIQNDTIVVVNTIIGGPSEKKGLLAGDRIVNIDDKNVAGIKITNKDVMKSLKGKKGTEVKVGIKRSGLKLLSYYTITRDVIPTYSIDVSYMASNTIGYIKISQFTATTANEFEKSTEKLLDKGMKSLILDLRGNTGGFLNAAVDIADQFLPEDKLIVYTQGRKSAKEDYYSTDKGKLENTKVVVLIDDWSASASEIVAGAIQDNDRGTIIGRRSFGKGLVQNQIQLTDGSAIRLTIARYYTPTGRCIQKSYTGSLDDYYEDLLNRIEKGELEHPDSIRFADSLKFKTPKGKIVYGGGGIMPDIYIPLSKSENNIWFNTIFNLGLINRFAFDYADSHRDEIKTFKSAENYYKYFNISASVFNDFLLFIQKQGLKNEPEKIIHSKAKIETWLKAFIGRNVFGDEAFYPVWLKADETFIKANETLK